MTKYWRPLPQAACYVRAWEEAYLHSWWASLFLLTYPCKSLNKSLEEFQNLSLLGGVTACWTWLSHSKPWSNLFYSILSQRYLILKSKEKFEVNQYILWWPQGQWASCGMLVLAWPDLQENERILPLYERTFTDAVYIAACMIVKKRRPGNPQVSLLSDNTLGFCWQLEYC